MGEGVTRLGIARGESQISNGFILRIAKLLNLKSCHNSLPSEWVTAVRRLVNREIKETGTSEDVPRTAAITHAAGIKKAPADVMGALLRLELHGFPHPVAELAATGGRLSRRSFCCNLRERWVIMWSVFGIST